MGGGGGCITQTASNSNVVKRSAEKLSYTQFFLTKYRQDSRRVGIRASLRGEWKCRLASRQAASSRLLLQALGSHQHHHHTKPAPAAHHNTNPAPHHHTSAMQHSALSAAQQMVVQQLHLQVDCIGLSPSASSFEVPCASSFDKLLDHFQGLQTPLTKMSNTTPHYYPKYEI